MQSTKNVSYLTVFTLFLVDSLIKQESLGTSLGRLDIPLVKNTSYSEDTIIEHEVTVVTAFIKVNNASKKHKYDYVECAKKTLSLPNPMVIYISEDLYEEVKQFRTELGLIDCTQLIILTVENFYMYSEKNLLDQCCMKNNSPYNNSLYIMSVNSRYSYLDNTNTKLDK